MKIINKEQVNTMHKMLIKEFGGIDGIRDDNLLESALHNAFQTFDGTALYPTVVEKAADLCFSLIKNHAYLDGNKRIGILVMLVFLDINDCSIECSNEELIEIGISIANGSMGQRDILAWINRHLKLEYSGTLVKTKIDKFLNVSGSRHCSIKQQCREVALCWRDVPDG